MRHRGSTESRLMRFLSDVSEGAKGPWAVRVVQRKVLEVRDSGNERPRRTEKLGSPETGRTLMTREGWQVGSETAGPGLQKGPSRMGKCFYLSFTRGYLLGSRALGWPELPGRRA